MSQRGDVTNEREKQMHNGVLHTEIINGHEITVTEQSTMVALNPNGCIHTAEAFRQYVLTVDNEIVTPPALDWEDANGVPFVNLRRGAFDTLHSAVAWAHRYVAALSPAPA